jgi:hypothetical protein
MPPWESVANAALRAFARLISGSIVVAYFFQFGATTLAAEATVARAGDFTVSAWSVEDGLPGNAVWALAPTRDGYLWAAGLNWACSFSARNFQI